MRRRHVREVRDVRDARDARDVIMLCLCLSGTNEVRVVSNDGPEKRYYCSMAAIGSKLYLFGSFTGTVDPKVFDVCACASQTNNNPAIYISVCNPVLAL